MFKGRQPLENAPYWYNTPLEKLDFEWSPEETREIERICEKIHKNIEEEGGMTPYERWHAAMWGEDKDRMFMGIPHNNPYAVKVLDSAADAYKPIDIYQFPKQYVKAHLMMMARFKLDYSCMHNTNYGEDMWGGLSAMIEYGNPIIKGEPPIKCLEDLEGMPIPDARKDGLYPGYIWAVREYRRIVEKYKLPIVVWPSICPSPALLAMMGMMGWTEYSIALRKNPELAKACTEIGTQFLCGFGKALVDEAQVDALTMCAQDGGFPCTNEKNLWIADHYRRVGETICQYSKDKAGKELYMGWGLAFMGKSQEFFETMYEHGGQGPVGTTFNGGTGGQGACDLDKLADWCHERELYLSFTIEDHTIEFGTPSEIEEAIKQQIMRHKDKPKFGPSFKPTYFTSFENVEIGVAALKKYGRYE